MNKQNLCLVLACVFTPVIAAANAAHIEIVKRQSQLEVKVEQAPMAEVLDKLATAAGIDIHHGELPDTTVSANCSSNDIKTVLDCLFKSDTDLVLGYSEQSGVATDIWLLGKSGLNCPENTRACTRTVPAQSPSTHTEDLLAMASSEDPSRRSAAISALAHEAQDNDKAIHDCLVNALSDPNPQVRTQAISSLSKREGKAATDALQQALHDTDAAVRLMAVSLVNDNPEILMQAMGDTDKIVSSLASMKLEKLDAH